MTPEERRQLDERVSAWAGDSVQLPRSSGLAKQEFRRQLGLRIGSLRKDRRMSRAGLARQQRGMFSYTSAGQRALSQLGRESLLIRRSGASWEGRAGGATWIRHESSGNTSGKRLAAFAGTAGHGYIYGRTLTPSSKSGSYSRSTICILA